MTKGKRKYEYMTRPTGDYEIDIVDPATEGWEFVMYIIHAGDLKRLYRRPIS